MKKIVFSVLLSTSVLAGEITPTQYIDTFNSGLNTVMLETKVEEDKVRIHVPNTFFSFSSGRSLSRDLDGMNGTFNSNLVNAIARRLGIPKKHHLLSIDFLFDPSDCQTRGEGSAIFSCIRTKTIEMVITKSYNDEVSGNQVTESFTKEAELYGKFYIDGSKHFINRAFGRKDFEDYYLRITGSLGRGASDFLNFTFDRNFIKPQRE